MKILEKFGSLFSRIFIGALFFMAGFGKIPGFEGTKSYIASVGLPFVTFFAILAIVIELGGSILLFMGLKTRIAALSLILFLTPVTFIFHHNFADRSQMIKFLNNFAVVGGLIYIFTHGGGSLSIDYLINKKKD